MDDLDRSILTAIQADLPAEERPFDALAARLRRPPDEVIARVRRMMDEGLIRRLGPVFDSRGLGYASTLVAARVPPGRLDEVAARVNRLPGVTHNYERRGPYNLWFTLTARSRQDLDRTLERLRQETGLPDIHSLPALAVYKIRVQFDLADEDEAERSGAGDLPREVASDGLGSPTSAARGIPSEVRGGTPDPPRQAAPAPMQPAPLTEEQKELVRLLQDGLAPEREPLVPLASHLGWPPARIVDEVRRWLASGVIRRFGAVVRHRDLGFAANGMAVFAVPPEGIDDVGRRLAAFPEVSHCYRRPPLPDFPYTLYAMAHGASEDKVRVVVGRMAEETGPAAYEILFSVREFKKTSMRYFLEDRPG